MVVEDNEKQDVFFERIIITFIQLLSQFYSRVSVVFVLLTIYFFPTKSTLKWIQSNTLIYRWFPPKHKLLTEEEYIMQGSEETQKALEQLREYCK